MARIRSIKPEFWKNEKLGEMPCEAQLLFIGLWNLCDRRGFIEHRPKRIKAEIFPYRDVDIIGLLSILEEDFIRIIHIENVSYIHVINFAKHQVINMREPESTVPEQYWNCTSTVNARGEGKGREGKGREGEGENEMQEIPPPQILHNPISSSNNSMLTYDETLKEFMNSHTWQHKFCMDHHLELDYVVKDMKDFLKELDKQDQFPRKLSDSKFHYTKRLEKHIKNQIEITGPKKLGYVIGMTQKEKKRALNQ